MIRRALLSLVVMHSIAFAEHPLHVAWRIADERFNGWQYGSQLERQQINCVQFLVKLVEELVGRSLTERERKALLIQNIRKREQLQRLVDRNDRRTKGIQYALVSMNRGKRVALKNARAGDFVQYWYKKDSVWVGHAALIQQVMVEADKYCAFIFGAHESSNSIGIAGYQITLNDPLMKVYIVRYH